MILYLYRWKLKEDKVTQFTEAWSYVTKTLLEHGSLGSRLHLGSDGIHYGYAQWPNEQARNNLKVTDSKIEEARQKMRDAIEESFPETVLTPLKDFLNISTTESFNETVPILNQITVASRNLESSISFYEKLDFKVIVRTEHYSRLENLNGFTLSIEILDENGQAGPTALYFEHSNLDLYISTLKDKGLVFENELEDKQWLWKEAWLRDPFGNRVCVYYAGSNRRWPPWRLKHTISLQENTNT